MSGLSRRNFVVTAAIAPLLPNAVFAASGANGAPPLLFYDATLAAGRRFSAYAQQAGAAPISLQGDRVRQVQRMIAATSPQRLFGVTRHADAILVEEIAGELGYRPLASVRHLATGSAGVRCDGPRSRKLAGMADAAGNSWPEMFAAFSLGKSACGAGPRDGISAPAFSWILAKPLL